MNMNMNPNSELQQSVVSVPDLVQVPEDLLNQAKEFQEAIMMYSCAIREVKTKLEVLNDDLSIRNQRNPIEVIKSRVKKPRSIVEKLHLGYLLERYGGEELTPEAVEQLSGHICLDGQAAVPQEGQYLTVDRHPGPAQHERRPWTAARRGSRR